MTAGQTLFYASSLAERAIFELTYSAALDALVDELGVTRVDLTDDVGQDWELGVPYLAGMDRISVDAARLDLRALRVQTPAEGWTATKRDTGWRITLPRAARLVSIAFDTPKPVVPQAKTLRLIISPAAPAGPPMFIQPPFDLGPAYANVPRPVTQRDEGGQRIVSVPPTLGTAWLLQWGYGDDAKTLAPVAVTTAVRTVTVESALSDARLELRAEQPADQPVVLWSHPGVLDPAHGKQPVDMAPIARKRLGDRLAAANTGVPPVALTLPVRLVAASGGPVGVSGTELRVEYAADAVDGPTAVALRGYPRPLPLSVPAGQRPSGGAVSITARHLGRELNGPVGGASTDGGPGRTVSVEHWAAVALPVLAADTTELPVVLAAVTLDVGVDAQAELAVEVRADVHGLPGAVLASAVTVLPPGPRAVLEVVLDPPPAVPAGAVVWVCTRTTTGVVRWYDDPAELRPPELALAAVAFAVRRSSDGGETWVPDEATLSGDTMPRARLLHRVSPPYTAPELTVRSGHADAGRLVLEPGGMPEEFVLSAGSVPRPLAELAGRTTGTARAPLTVHVATRAALDVRFTAVELRYSPTATPTGS